MLRTSLLVALCGLIGVSATLTLPNAISSNMVLQRGPQKALIWGKTSRAGDVVTAYLDDVKYQVFSSSTDGTFTIEFDPQSASVDRTIKLSDKDEQVVLDNVAFGDVYICSGQSNMEFALRDSFDNGTAIPDSKNYPNLRLFTIAKKASLTPLNYTVSRFSDKSNWVVSAPAYVDGPSMDYFSATCYYFARELYKAVNMNGDSVPVGAIDTCWGGTYVEAWTTPAGLAECPAAEDTTAIDFPEARETGYQPSKRRFGRLSSSVQADPDPNTPSVLWNGMINPIVQMRVRGAVWYQGEANAANPVNYACRFPAMINDWRTQFNNYNLFFGFVLLAAYKEGGNPTWPLIRDAQLAAMQLPLVHVASAQDLGDEASPQGSIHPRNKTFVGARLALGAQKIVYKQDVVSVGPSVADVLWPVDSSSTQSVIVRFNPSQQNNEGLGLRDTSQCDLCCKNIAGSAMTVGTSDHQWLRAQVTVDADAYIAVATVTGLKAGVDVVSVQHGYEDYQQCALYNQFGLPLLPFNISRFN